MAGAGMSDESREEGKSLICIMVVSVLGFLFWGIVFGLLFLRHIFQSKDET